MTDEARTYRRSQLYEEVWKEPLRTVARRYGVSDVALGRVCRKLHVPLPGRGFWARVQLGRGGPRPALPQLADGAPDELITKQRGPRHSLPATRGSEATEVAIAVPMELRNPHKLVAEASRLLRGRKPEEALLRCRSSRCLDITVSPDALGRALRIMNTLVCSLEGRGLRVEVTRPRTYEERARGGVEVPGNATRVMISGEWIQFGLTERRSVMHPPAPTPPRGLRGPALESWISANEPRTELVANGILELSIKDGQYLGVRTTWHDGKHKRVEGCLADFISHLQPMAEAMKRYREELERAAQERRDGERRRWEEEQRRREEEERGKHLEEALRRWRLARDAREYVAEVRGVIALVKGALDGCEIERELLWAEEFAARMDPVEQLRDAVAKRASQRAAKPS